MTVEPIDLTLYDGIAAAHGGDYERAIRLLGEVIAARPDDEQAWFWLALASPTVSEALPRLRKVTELAPHRTEARDALGQLLAAQGLSLARTDEAAALLLLIEAAAIRPDDQRVWLGLAHVAPGDRERLSYLERVLSLSPNHPQARSEMLAVLARSSRQLARDGQGAEARALLEQAAKLSPDDVRVWIAMAHVAETPEAAVEVLRHAVSVDPTHAAAASALAAALVSQAVVERDRQCEDIALALCREAVATDSTNAAGWTMLAALEPGDAAAAAAERAIALDAVAAAASEAVRTVVLEAGIGALRDGNEARARQLLTQAVRVDEGNERAWVAFSQVAQTADERLTALRRVIAINPEHVRAKRVLVALLLSEANTAREHDAARARACYGEAAQVDPASEDAWLGMAALETEADGIMLALEQAAIANPGNAETAARLAHLRATGEDTVPHAPVPAASAAPAAAKAAAPASAAPSPSAAGKPTILVVDDSPTVRTSLSLALEREGYRVVTAPDGEQALATLETTTPDLIFLDIAMPQLDGYEVCRRIKKNPKLASVPVIMLSGKDGFFDKVRGKMAGATEYLTKPFETPTLLAAVTTHLTASAR